jgi:hypothetical protein
MPKETGTDFGSHSLRAEVKISAPAEGSRRNGGSVKRPPELPVRTLRGKARVGCSGADQHHDVTERLVRIATRGTRMSIWRCVLLTALRTTDVLVAALSLMKRAGESAHGEGGATGGGQEMIKKGA